MSNEMIKNKPEAYGISSDNLLCMVQELETFVEDIHSISVVCDNDVIFQNAFNHIRKNLCRCFIHFRKV